MLMAIEDRYPPARGWIETGSADSLLERNKSALKGHFCCNAVGYRQDFGIDGSIFSAQARMPPLRFETFVNPACFRASAALWLRTPALQ
jgi:hypothetical protein